MPGTAFLLLAVFRPPEIHPSVRVALGLLVPLAVASCLAAHPVARRRLLAALPSLAAVSAFLAANAWLALQPYGALVASERLALLASAFLVFRELAAGEERGRTVLFAALAVSGCAVSLVGLAQKAYGFERLAHALRDETLASFAFRQEALARIASGRVFGTLLLPASLAGLLTLTIPVTAAIAIRPRSRRTLKAAAICGCLLQAAALAATGSMAGCATLAVSAAATAWLAAGTRKKRLAIAGALCVGGLLLIATIARSRGVDRVDLLDPTHPAGQRLGNWIAGARMLAANPVFGAGGGGYAVLYPLFREAGMNESRHAHNSYLELAVEYGPVVIPALALFIVSTLVRWRRACGRGAELAAASVGLPAFLLHNVVDFTAYQPGVAVPFAALLGALWDSRRPGADAPEIDLPGEPQSVGARPLLGRGLALVAVLFWAGFLVIHSVTGGAADVLLEKASLRLAEGDAESALSLARGAAALSPLDPAPAATQASILIRSGRPAEAVGPALRAQSLDPVAAQIEFLVGTSLFRAGRPAEAYVKLARAERLHPLRADYRKAREEIESAIGGWSDQ